jgi:small subunit ribosomal protein S16
MATKIRLQRFGKKGKPFYHVVVADARSPRDGKFIERLGSYDPNSNPATILIDFDKALDWVNKGAQPTDTCRSILSYKGVMYKKHLEGGIRKGALTQEQADAKFEEWLKGKESKIETKKTGLSTSKEEARKAALAAEAKKKEERAAAVLAKNTPPEEVEEGGEEAAESEEGNAEVVADTAGENSEFEQGPPEAAVKEEVPPINPFPEPAAEAPVEEGTEEFSATEVDEQAQVLESTEEAADTYEGDGTKGLTETPAEEKETAEEKDSAEKTEAAEAADDAAESPAADESEEEKK